MTNNTMTPLLIVSDRFKNRWPGASAGVLAVREVSNPEHHNALDRHLAATEVRLKTQYGNLSRVEIRESGNLSHYHKYYRSFGQNYHVQHQIESIAQKGKEIPRRAALVEAAFRSELEDGLLTGIHDLDQLALPIVLDIGDETATYLLYNGAETTVKEDDMYFRDQRGVLSSVILGPASYGRVTPQTRAVVATVYGAPGVAEAAIRRHLESIWSDIQLISPAAKRIAQQTASV